ncbi:MAG: ComF family protein [Verrucomicrobiota bacterium]
MNGSVQWLSRIVSLIYPRNCQFCTIPLLEHERGVICPSCLALAKRIKPPFCRRCSLPFSGQLDDLIECGYCKDLKFRFSRATAACRAEGLVRDCIHRLKYKREMYFSFHLAGWLIDAGREHINWNAVDAIVPVPLHPLKQRDREFNQAELLTRSLSREFDKPVIANGVRRVKETQTQTKLDASARRANLRAAFAAGRGQVTGLRLVLVDDVFTTGATLDSCANLLINQGAVDVVALTVARGI